MQASMEGEDLAQNDLCVFNKENMCRDDMLVATLSSFMTACFAENTPSRVAVALSGGPDSMALVLALVQWRQQQGVDTDIVPLIVDHGLRPESASEALYVADLVRQWGLCAQIIPWKHSQGKEVGSGVMELARQARYRLMAYACASLGIEHLFVGHHGDDVMETISMRHSDHTPWYGQAGMSCAVYRLGVWILRPWLDVTKSDIVRWLTDTLAGESLWVEDPSNQRLCFARVRVRQEIRDWSASTRKQHVMRMVQYAAQKQEHMATVAQKVMITRHDAALVVRDVTAFAHDVSGEEGCWLLQAWLGALTFRPWPRLPAQHSFWRRIQDAFAPLSPPPYRVLGPLGGCLWVQQRHHLWIFREHHAVHNMPTWRGDMLWDDRVFAPQGIGLSVVKEGEGRGAWHERWQRLALPAECSFPVTPPWRTVWCGWPWPLFCWQPPLLSSLPKPLHQIGLIDQTSAGSALVLSQD